jgi:hypothetical protein
VKFTDCGLEYKVAAAPEETRVEEEFDRYIGRDPIA